MLDATYQLFSLISPRHQILVGMKDGDHRELKKKNLAVGALWRNYPGDFGFALSSHDEFPRHAYPLLP